MGFWAKKNVFLFRQNKQIGVLNGHSMYRFLLKHNRYNKSSLKSTWTYLDVDIVYIFV